MKVFNLLVFILISKSLYSAETCRLNPKYSYYSLSSPITMLLEELSLLDSVAAISTFHPVKSKTVTKLAGGLFISKRAFKKSKKEKIIFFDDSMEMRKNLSKLNQGVILEVFTRKLGAIEAYKVSVEVLSSFLLNCTNKIKALNKKVDGIKNKLSQIKNEKLILFYLGAFHKDKGDPNLLIVNDGFVKDLLQTGKIKTYPSQLEYVSWSKKILKSLPKYLALAIEDGELDLLDQKKIKENKINIEFRGALSPGIRQVYFLEALLDNVINQVKVL